MLTLSFCSDEDVFGVEAGYYDENAGGNSRGGINRLRDFEDAT